MLIRIMGLLISTPFMQFSIPSMIVSIQVILTNMLIMLNSISNILGMLISINLVSNNTLKMLVSILSILTNIKGIN